MKKLQKLLVWMFSLLLAVTAAAVVAGLSFRFAAGTVPESMPHHLVNAPNGVVASSQPLASQAGLKVLQDGGNAVDAAVTTAAVLSVIEPFMSGIGGDMFAIMWSAQEEKLIGINASGRSGSLMSADSQLSGAGPRSVTVPGALSGWAALLEAHGTITLAEALEPAIVLAEVGFPISDSIASEWTVFASKVSYDPNARATFLIDDERAPEPGEWFSNPAYAETLRLIARDGPEVLYGGELGQRIAEHIQRGGGYLTLNDFREHKAEWVEPMSVPFGQYRLWELPPNGQGIAALEMLRILDSYDLAAMGHNTTSYLHHLIEAKKLAFADLQYFVADPQFMQIDPEQLLADDFIEQRRSLIQPDRALARVQPDSSLTTTDTTYFAVADKDGNMISFISSLAAGFGSGVVVENTGFALQNRGVGFSDAPGERANSPGPRRLPFHTIIPGFVTRTGDDGRQQPWLAFGIVGGDQQPQAQVQVLLNMLVFGMNAQEALDAPRFRHWGRDSVGFEQAIASEVVEELRSMGHAPQNPVFETLQMLNFGQNRILIFGGGQAIVREQRGYTAGSDSRSDGLAAAY